MPYSRCARTGAELGGNGPAHRVHVFGHNAAPAPSVKVAGVKLAYDDSGSGECVVLIHGHPFDRTLWQPQRDVLSRQFRVVAPDLRGFGHSPITQHLVTMRELATDIEELLGNLGIGRAAVVGLSMGGLVAMELAASQPDRYWAIGLVATTMAAPTPAERAARRARADAVEGDGMQVLLDYMHTGVYGPKCPESVRERVDAMMSAAPPVGAAAALRGRAERPDYRPLLAGLDIPALVCAGSADPWSDRDVTAEIIAHLKRPEPVMIDGVGHLPNLEAPDEFNNLLRAFLHAHAPS
jgi:3-oxoadipate enol-lactonase